MAAGHTVGKKISGKKSRLQLDSAGPDLSPSAKGSLVRKVNGAAVYKTSAEVAGKCWALQVEWGKDQDDLSS